MTVQGMMEALKSYLYGANFRTKQDRLNLQEEEGNGKDASRFH
jgi:hypothetical protein